MSENTRDDTDAPTAVTAASDFPPAPWKVQGTMELGLFPLVQEVDVPHGFVQVLPRHICIGTMRYLGGDLTYDLFLVASTVRHRHRIGMHIHYLRVTDLAAAHAGATKWGLPAVPGQIDFNGEQVSVTSKGGTDISFIFRARSRLSVPLVMPLGTFGRYGDWLLYAGSMLRANARLGDMRIQRWPEQLPRLRQNSAVAAFEIPRFHMTVPQARPIGLL